MDYEVGEICELEKKPIRTIFSTEICMFVSRVFIFIFIFQHIKVCFANHLLDSDPFFSSSVGVRMVFAIEQTFSQETQLKKKIGGVIFLPLRYAHIHKKTHQPAKGKQTDTVIKYSAHLNLQSYHFCESNVIFASAAPYSC